VVCFGMFVINDGALRAVKKLYIRLYASRDSGAVGGSISAGKNH
jgi:hypothetical protein